MIFHSKILKLTSESCPIGLGLVIGPVDALVRFKTTDGTHEFSGLVDVIDTVRNGLRWSNSSLPGVQSGCTQNTKGMSVEIDV